MLAHAGAALQPRMLPIARRAHQADVLEDGSAGMGSSWQNAGDLERVVISGGMGALGILVAAWLTSASEDSRPLLLGRSGRFSQGPPPAFLKVSLLDYAAVFALHQHTHGKHAVNSMMMTGLSICVSDCTLLLPRPCSLPSRPIPVFPCRCRRLSSSLPTLLPTSAPPFIS